jgi:hypothetical protein
VAINVQAIVPVPGEQGSTARRRYPVVSGMERNRFEVRAVVNGVDRTIAAASTFSQAESLARSTTELRNCREAWVVFVCPGHPQPLSPAAAHDLAA